MSIEHTRSRVVLGMLCSALVLAACAGLGSEPEAPSEPPIVGGDDAEHGDPPGADGAEATDADDGVAEPEGSEAEPEPDVEPEPDAEPAEPVRVPGPPTPVELSDSEVLPNAKQLASDVVQQLTTYDVEDEAADIAAAVVPADAVDELVRAAAPLYHEGAWSRGEIIYPQLGGATRTDTSVMVVVRQSIARPDGTKQEQTRTVDVRLTLVDGAWAFDGIADAGGEPVPRPDDLPPEAVAVLDDERIELPDSAVWDIHAGRTSRDLLRVMTAIAEQHDYGVVVLETGHPVYIFDTDRISTHLYGLAVDIYHLDGTLVVDDRDEGSVTHQLAEWLHDHPDVTNLGSPWALDGFGGRSFTDLVHQDHFHVEAGPRPDGPPPHRDDLADERGEA